MADQLVAILGVSQRRAAELLREAGGEVETAVALHFSSNGAASREAAADSPRSQLRSIVGMQLSRERAAAMLARAGGDVQLAADRFFAEEEEAGPSRRREQSEPITITDSEEDPYRHVMRDRPRSGAAQQRSGRAAPTPASARGRQQQQQQQAVAPSTSEEETSSSEDDEDSSSEEGSSSEGEEGSGEQAAAGFRAFQSIFHRFLQHPHLLGVGSSEEEEDSDEESEEEAAVAAASPRPCNTGNAPVLRYLPSLQSAAAIKASTGGDGPELAQELPLPQLRNSQGRLHCDKEESVPPVVAPPCSLPAQLKLGALLLPLHWLNPAAQPQQLAREWVSKEAGRGSCGAAVFQCPAPFYGFGRGYVTYAPMSFGSGRDADETATQLLLTDGPLQPVSGPPGAEVALVQNSRSWVSQSLAALYALTRAGLVTWTLTLQPQPGGGGGGKKAAAGAAAAAAAAAGTSSGKGAHVSGRRPAGKGGAKGGSAKAGEKGATAGGAAEAGAAAQPVRPTHARVEVVLQSKPARTQLWWAGERCEELSKQGARALAQAKGHRKLGEAMAKLLAALLAHGEGLALGPDSDGILNFMDTPAEAWGQLPNAGSAAYRKLFDVERLLDSVKPDPLAHAAPPPAGLAAHPKHYQLQGLRWMQDRERRGDALGRGQLLQHPEWLQLATPEGRLLYLHRLPPYVLSDNMYTAPVGGTCGGFLCDEMGLGKTLQMLMLVMSNPAPRGWAVKSLEGATTGGEEGEQAVPIRTTLVVVPANLLEQWGDEISLHLHSGALKWATYKPGLQPAKGPEQRGPDWATPKKGQRRSRRVLLQEAQAAQQGAPVQGVWCETPDKQLLPLHEADLVLMSYEQLRDELNVGAGRSSPLQQFGFWRVVLDEAQLVANSSSVAAVMASSLWRRHAWVVTGTPITARLDEVKGLLEFLAYEPWYHNTQWRGLVQGEFSEQSAAGLLSMRALLRGVMLRRSKADVAGELDLPPCTREDRWVQLSSVERLVYEQAKRGFLDAAFHLRQQTGGPVGGRQRHSSKAASRSMAALAALRQSCCHPQIVRRTDDTLGKERLSMRQIMDRLVTQAYSEWDATARALLYNRALLAAVLAGEGSHPGEALRPFLDLVRHSWEASLSTDIRHQAAQRTMDGSLAPAAQQQGDGEAGPSAAAAAGAGRGSGPSAPAAKQQQAQQQQQQEQEQPDDKGKGKAPASQPVNGRTLRSGSVPLSGRKRGREGSADAGAGPSSNGGSGAEGSKPNGQLVAADKGGMEEGQEGAEEEVSEEEREKRKEARARGRYWQKLELDLLELYRHMLARCAADPPAPKASSGRARAAKRARTPGASTSAAAAAAGNGGRDLLQAELQEAALAVERLQAELGLDEGPSNVRRSKRQAGVNVEEEIVMDERGVEALQEQLLAAKVVLKEYSEALRRRDPEKSVRTAVAAAEKAAREKWHHLQHLLNKEAALVAAEKGKAAAAEDALGPTNGKGKQQPPEQAAAAAQQEDLSTCPICLDELTMRTITSCGHHYCPVCIREVLATGRRVCPICRNDIREEDLFDACSDEEARLKEQAAAAAGNADYGSKVSALLGELAAMKAADPGAKAVVFSSWGRLLKLVGDALTANGVEHASLCGASLQQRQDALHRFTHDPACSVLSVVMSTSGGAAGLTLTVASTAFILEPTLNPGLEAQAAARIYRLGQTRPTRVIRLLAQDTVESRILELQKAKLESGQGPAELGGQEVDAGVLVSLYEELK